MILLAADVSLKLKQLPSLSAKDAEDAVLMLQNTFQRRDTASSRSSSMELPEDIPHRAPPRHSIDVRQASSARHSTDLSRAHSVRAPGAAAAQASTLSRGSTSQTDNSSWDNVSDENKGIIRQVTEKMLCLFVNVRAGWRPFVWLYRLL